MQMFDREQMLENIQHVQCEIAEVAKSAGRDPSDITLIGVSKFFPAEYARQAFELGLHDLGENRPEEMHEKKALLDEEGVHPRWHLIGTIQSSSSHRRRTILDPLSRFNVSGQGDIEAFSSKWYFFIDPV